MFSQYAKSLWNDCRTCFAFYVAAMFREFYCVVFLYTTSIFHMHCSSPLFTQTFFEMQNSF